MLVVLVGIPGAGKSSYARSNFRHIVSPDAIRLEEFGVRFDPRIEPEVWKRAYERVAAHLARRDVVCFDATSATRRRRQRLVRLANDAQLPAIAVWFSVPIELAWERNVAREAAVPRRAFRQLARALEPPSTEEGFVAVVTIDASKG